MWFYRTCLKNTSCFATYKNEQILSQITEKYFPKKQTKKQKNNTKVTEIENKLNNNNHDKYIDTSEFDKLAPDIFNARIAQKRLITKTEFDSKLSNLNRKITANKSKHLLVENELNKLKTFDSSYFIGKSFFEEVFLVF